MDRYTKVNGADSAPAAPPAPDHLYPTSGTPGSVPATTMGPWWAHMVTEEIRNVIVAAGMTPDFANLTQLASAIQALGASKPGMLMSWPNAVCPSWALVRDGSAMSRTAYAALFAVLCPTRNMTTASGTKNLTGLSDTRDLYVGMPIEGAGIQAGATIETITSASAATMSLNATASATVPVRLFPYGYGTSGSASTFGVPDDRGLFERGLDTGSRGYESSQLAANTTASNTTITGLSSTRGLFVGMSCGGPTISGTSTITAILGPSSVQVSPAPNATGSSTTVTFYGGQMGNERFDETRAHSHGYADGTFSWQTGASNVSPGQVNQTNPAAVVRTAPSIGSETRPRFRNYLPIITF